MSWSGRVAGVLGAALAVAFAGCARDAGKPQAPVALSASLDASTATVGDRVTYRLRIERDKDLAVVLPQSPNQLGGLEIVNAGEVPERRLALLSSRRVEERWWELRADLVGVYEIPAFEVGVRSGDGEAELSTVASEPVTLVVESVLPADGSAEDILDIKPLHGRPGTWPWGWTIAALAVAALAVAALLYARRRRSEVPATPAVPAHLLAYQALDELKAQDLDDPESVRRWYFALSATLRTYVEGRFGLNATDLTSEEILDRLTSSRRPARRREAAVTRLELDGEADALLRRFLLETDRVKYADENPPREVAEATWGRARRFVEVTEPRPAEEPSSEAADGEKAA